MNIQKIRVRRAIEGCLIDAYPRWQKHGVRIANHSGNIDGQHYEWLSLIQPDGSVRVWQHHPEDKTVCVLSSAQVSQLVTPDRTGYSKQAIRAHVRSETRRRH